MPTNTQEEPVDPWRARIEAALDRMDTDGFFLLTYLSSGPETVRQVLLETPEMALCLEHEATARKGMLERLRTTGQIERPETRIAYFVLFERAGGPSELAAVLDWIEALPDGLEQEINSPWHPWSYGLAVLRRFASPGAIPDAREAYGHRRALRALVP